MLGIHNRASKRFFIEVEGPEQNKKNCVEKIDYVEVLEATELGYLVKTYEQLLDLNDESGLQMTIIKSLLNWYHLLVMGFLPKIENQFKLLEIINVKEFLGVSHFYEILKPNNSSLSRLVDRFNASNRSVQADTLNMSQFFVMNLVEKFYSQLTSDAILSNIAFIFTLEDVENYRSIFDKMDLSTKLRWAFYTSISSSYFLEMQKSPLSEEWMTSIPAFLHPLLQKMDESILEMKKAADFKKL